MKSCAAGSRALRSLSRRICRRNLARRRPSMHPVSPVICRRRLVECFRSPFGSRTPEFTGDGHPTSPLVMTRRRWLRPLRMTRNPPATRARMHPPRSPHLPTTPALRAGSSASGVGQPLRPQGEPCSSELGGFPDNSARGGGLGPPLMVPEAFASRRTAKPPYPRPPRCGRYWPGPGQPTLLSRAGQAAIS